MRRSDVKWLWELGRFGVAYSAVRAYACTGDGRYPEFFWRLVEGWREANPPNVGVHWMCGQECAVRVLAWTFAWFAFRDAQPTTDARTRLLIETLAAHGDRIEANLSYARSQKNNHSVNEALALWTLGTVCPALQGAARWERLGRLVLEEEARRQIYADGAYIQHSLGYQRFVLESYAWAVELARRVGRPFSPELLDRYRRATSFLYEVVDETSGRAPNYGSNDGSRLLKLDACEPFDMRPTLALAFWVGNRRRVFPPGPWDEPATWLCTDDIRGAPVAPLPSHDLAAAEGGYYTLRAGETWGFVRCAAYRDRPAQADMLHLDVWWRGHNLVADPGTYSYTSAAPWSNGLAGTAVHNAVALNGLDQMARGPRFLWLHWCHGRIVRHGAVGETVKVIEGEHDGYVGRLGVRHRRAVLLVADRTWVVIDDLLGAGTHDFGSLWLLPRAKLERPLPRGWRVRAGPGTCNLSFFDWFEGSMHAPATRPIEATDGDARGWFSPGYLQKEPALALVSAGRGRLPVRRVTVLGLGEGVSIERVEATDLTLAVDGRRFVAEWRDLGYQRGESLVRSVVEVPEGR